MPEPTSPSQIPSDPAPRPAAPPKPSMPRSGGSSIGTVVLIVVILVIGFLWMSQTRISGYNQDWQAVFLTNGQVYFGQVKKQNNVELVVKDIYYLQVTRPLQQTEEGEQQQNPQGELSLVKLGNELHGPTDSMFINRDHVLFVEDLKDDSNVVQAIDNYKTGQ
ncbi:MAG: hypothetical protein QF747_01875 [Patescibacteria group bacterium]|nr:hypothetical protein [Patescibacteria group bacterium]MDP6756140.1 hypothetical protein [Patescibacteria group bacterium]